MDVKSPDPLAIRPSTAPGKAAVAVAYVGLYELAALWGKNMEVLPGITPWFPAVGLTVSIGIATFPSVGVASTDDLINRADEALYRAKAAGRNQVRS